MWEGIVAILGIVSTLLTLGIGIWKYYTDKGRKEAERRAREDLDAAESLKKEQSGAATEGEINDIQDKAEEEWRKKHQG